MLDKQKTIPGDSYLFVLPWQLDALGGVNQVVINLMKQFEFHGAYNPLLLVSSWDNTTITEITPGKCRLLSFRMRSPWNANRPIKNLLAFILELPHTLQNLRNFLLRENVRAINAHYPGIFLYQFILLKLFGLFTGKIILSFHGSDIRCASRKKGIERTLWKILFKLADAIVVCSEDLKREVLLFIPECIEKVHAIHNGVDIKSLLTERDKIFSLDLVLQDKPFILNIATFEYKKGQDVLIKAFASLAARYPDVNLVLVGRPAEAYDELKSLLSFLQLQERVFLCEGVSHDKIATFLENATIFCLPSRKEPFGIVVLEAGIFSIPVIASKVGGIPEIISHNETGRLFEPEDINALSNEIIRLLENPKERQRLGTNLHDHVLADFTWQSAYQKYTQLL